MSDVIHQLGRNKTPHDPRNLRFAKYVGAAIAAGALPAPPDALNWNKGSIPWGMMKNDSLGDCCIAGVGHIVLEDLFTTTGTATRPNDNQIVDMYCRACAYVRGNAKTDQGCGLQPVLNYWRNFGIAIGNDPVVYKGTLISGAFKAGENLICQTADPHTAKLLVLDQNGQPMNPTQIPAWSFSGTAPTFKNILSADKQSAQVNGPEGSNEQVTVKDGALSTSTVISFVKDTGILVSQSGGVLTLTSELYPFQPGDVIVGVSSGAQFKVAADNVSVFPTMHKIHSYVQLGTAFGFNPNVVPAAQAHLELKLAIQLFGAAYCAVELPKYSQSGWASKVWDVPPTGLTGNGARDSWGGHCVPIIGYDAVGPYFVTWSKVCHMTWAYYDTYFDEAYAPLSTDWINNATKLSASGFDFATLLSDLGQLPKAA